MQTPFNKYFTFKANLAKNIRKSSPNSFEYKFFKILYRVIFPAEMIISIFSLIAIFIFCTFKISYYPFNLELTSGNFFDIFQGVSNFLIIIGIFYGLLYFQKNYLQNYNNKPSLQIISIQLYAINYKNLTPYLFNLDVIKYSNDISYQVFDISKEEDFRTIFAIKNNGSYATNISIELSDHTEVDNLNFYFDKKYNNILIDPSSYDIQTNNTYLFNKGSSFKNFNFKKSFAIKLTYFSEATLEWCENVYIAKIKCYNNIHYLENITLLKTK